MRVEAVLFDLFDTLILLEGYEIYYPRSLQKLHASLLKNGINVAFEGFSRVYFEVRDQFYSESRESFEEPHFNVRVSQVLQRLGYNLDVSDNITIEATNAFAEEFMRHVSLDKDAINVLQKLHGKYKLGLISNSPIPEHCWSILEKFGLKKFFSIVLISGEINKRKPSPEIFKKALKALSVEASQTVFVGDMIDLDVMGPKNVGMKTIQIKRKPIEESTSIEPDKTITQLNQLLTVLEDC